MTSTLLCDQSEEDKGKALLLLDLDNTLIYASLFKKGNSDFVVAAGRGQGYYYVMKRPGLDKFLQEMSQLYELGVFTTAQPQYANQMIDVLDPEGLIRHRLCVNSCSRQWDEEDNVYIKDLSRLNRDLKKVILVDDNPTYFSKNKDNGILVQEFEGSSEDRELFALGSFLKSMAVMDDVRVGVRAWPQSSPPSSPGEDKLTWIKPHIPNLFAKVFG